MLLASLKGKKKVVKALSSTRWSARADAVAALKENYIEIKSALETIIDDREQAADAKVQASGFRKSMERFETIFLTHMWNEILSRINNVNKVLQKPTLTLSTSVTVLNSLTDYISKKRDSFERYVTKAEVIFGSTYKESEKTRTTKRSSRITYFDKTQTPETVLTGKDKLKIETFLPIIDTLVTNLKERSSKYETVAKRFGFLEDLVVLNESDLKVSCNAFSERYKDDVCGNELLEECLHLQSFLKEDVDLDKLFLKITEDDSDGEKDDDDITGGIFEQEDHEGGEKVQDEVHGTGSHSSSNRLNLKITYKHLQENGLLTAFPNVEICLRIFLCMMVSNASGERTFSKLKIVKSFHRSSLKQERLNSLSILSIENDILRKLNFHDVIDDFAAKKCRRKAF